jgi:hypothetical protein
MTETRWSSRRVILTVCFVVLGVVGLAAAWFVEGRWDWGGVTPSVLVNLGSALLLASVLVWFERQLERSTERAVESAVIEAREETSRQTRAINDRMDELAEQMRTLAAADQQQVQSTLDTAEVTPSYASIVAAFELAEQYHALYATSLVVPTSTHLTGPHLSFSWAPGPRRIGVDAISWDEPRELRITNDYQSSTRSGRRIASVTWPEHASAAETGNAITKALMAAGEWDSNHFDWTHTLRSLVTGLRLAVGSKRQEQGQPRLRGELFEVLDDRIVLTTSGAETRDGELLIAAEEVPRSTNSDEPRTQPWRPHQERPPWLTDEEWEWLVQRAFGRYRFRGYF